MGNYMDKRVTPPKRVTSLIWVPPPPRKQTLIHKKSIILQHAYFTMARKFGMGFFGG